MTNRIATTAAIILSLAVAGAPAASARPADYVPANHHAPTAVYDRPDREMIPVSPPAMNGGVSALQSLSEQARQRVFAVSGLSDQDLAGAVGTASAVADQADASPSVLRVHTPQTGFDWGEAGIATGLALLVIAAGGAFAVSTRRGRRTTALPS